MAIFIDDEAIESNKGGGFEKETRHVPSGWNLVRLTSYVEAGFHPSIYQGKPAVYDKGQKAGQVKPPEFIISLTWEFSGCPFDGDFPLTYENSIRMNNGAQAGGFINKLAVSDAFMKNQLPASICNKMLYKKFRDTINAHYPEYGKINGLHQAVGKVFAVQIQTKAKYKDPATGKEITCLDNQVPGYDKSDPSKNLPGVDYYINLKPECIGPMKQDMMGVEIDMSLKIVDQIGEYCPEFHWDSPTKEAWIALKPWQKSTIQKAVNFPDSPIFRLINSDPALLSALSEANGDDEDNPETTPMPSTNGVVPETVRYGDPVMSENPTTSQITHQTPPADGLPV